MQVLELAQIVWAECRQFSLQAGVPVQQLQMIRRAVADAALATGGRGFAAAEALPLASDPGAADAEGCLAAAQEAIAAQPAKVVPTVIAMGAANGTPMFGELALRSGWRNDAADIETFGPMTAIDAKDSSYFLYRARAAVAGDMRPGYLFERPVAVAAVLTMGPPKRMVWIGMAVFVAGLALLMVASLLATSVGWIALASETQFQLVDADAATACTTLSIAGEQDAWPIAVTEAFKPIAQRTDCNARWLRAVTTVVDGSASQPVEEYFTGDWLASWGRLLLRWTGGAHSLQLALLGIIGGIGLLLVSAGLVTQGKIDGALIDDRNRVSLTRAQLIAWTALLLAGIWAFGLANVGLSGQLFYALHAADVSTQATPVIFPQLEASLLALLGISTATPMFSGLILNRERATELEAVSPRDSRPEERFTPRESSYADLFQGETVGKASTVDIARVQHLAITCFLLGTYLTLVWQLAGEIDGAGVVRSVAKGTSLYPIMPVIDATFLELLLFSHAGLVVGKLADRGRGS